MYHFLSFLFLAVLVTTTSFAEEHLPENGVLPNKEIAIKVAETILVNVYGEQVLKERPFNAKLVDNYWIIDGTLHCNGCDGGVAHIEIGKKDARVRNVIHSK